MGVEDKEGGVEERPAKCPLLSFVFSCSVLFFLLSCFAFLPSVAPFCVVLPSVAVLFCSPFLFCFCFVLFRYIVNPQRCFSFVLHFYPQR